MKYSVVIRGKIFSHTQETIDSIRTWFDGEIILSTWDDQDISVLKNYDRAVLSKDPGPGPIQQMKRQLVSYKNGLENASGEVILVTRSDMVHYKNPFQYFGILKNGNEIFKIFEEKIVIGNMMSIHPERNCPGEENYQRYFRLNDWFQVGLKEDLNKWCDILDTVEENIDANICTEQFWFAGCLKKYFDKSINLNNLQLYRAFLWLAILNNFRILNTKTTLGANNKNWERQPENLICYLMEHEYNDKFIEIFGELK
jgi:hypothetical protein